MDNNYNKSVGERLLRARKEKGYSRAKVGELVGLHETTVKRYEDGDIKSLDIDRLKSFADVLGTSAAELLGWISNPDDNPDDKKLRLLAGLSEESVSGRGAVIEKVFELFGSDHSISKAKYMGKDTVAILYYLPMNRDAASYFQSIIDILSGMSPSDLSGILELVQSYETADTRIKEIVDTALKPYRVEESQFDEK